MSIPNTPDYPPDITEEQKLQIDKEFLNDQNFKMNNKDNTKPIIKANA